MAENDGIGAILARFWRYKPVQARYGVIRAGTLADFGADSLARNLANVRRKLTVL